MKAAYLVKTGAASSAFEIRETEVPAFRNHEILIRVETFGLNYADVMARNGIYAAAPPIPSILGYEVVGRIEKMGEAVVGFSVGDKVLAFTRFGGYAEYCVAPFHTVIQLPEDVPNDEATALATQYCTAIYSANWMANIRAKERVLIHAGAGGVGHALIQIAKQKGCEVIATAGSEEKINYLKSIGVDFAINYLTDNFELVLEKKFGKRPVDAIFDPIGGKNFKMNNCLLAVGGRMILYGISSFSQKKGTFFDKIQLAAQFGILSPLSFLINSNGIIGVNMLHVADRNPEIIGLLLEEAVEGYSKGTFHPKIAFSGKVNQLAKGHELLGNRETIGKVAINW
jgi:NADPH2:quinone reductase